MAGHEVFELEDPQFGDRVNSLARLLSRGIRCSNKGPMRTD